VLGEKFFLVGLPSKGGFCGRGWEMGNVGGSGGMVQVLVV